MMGHMIIIMMGHMIIIIMCHMIIIIAKWLETWDFLHGYHDQ